MRVFREAGPRGRLLLHDGRRLLDLTERLQSTGQPSDLVELSESGWFDEGELRTRLFGDEAAAWSTVDVEWDGNAPPGLDTPIDRRSVGKILCLGKNFRAHAEEFREEVPAEPLFFNKLPETLRGHNQEVSAPPDYLGRLDHEVELAVLIGREARCIDATQALEYVVGYSVANDLTLRSMQGADRKRSYPWFRSKNFDGSLPLGPCFVPAAYFQPGDQKITAHVNGELRQSASLDELEVGVPEALAYLSRHLTLHRGDIVLMGTPAGVGPLGPGDEVICSIAGIGNLRTTIVASG